MVDSDRVVWVRAVTWITSFYYIDTGVSLENTPLVKFIGNCIRDLSDVFSISSLMEISITSFPAFSRLFVFGWLSVCIIKRTLYVSSKIWVVCSRGKNSLEISMHYSWLGLPPCKLSCGWNFERIIELFNRNTRSRKFGENSKKLWKHLSTVRIHTAFLVLSNFHYRLLLGDSWC